MLDMPRRVVSGDKFWPVEYDAEIAFEGWETEDGTEQTGWDIEVKDSHHNRVILIRFNGKDDTVTVRAAIAVD